MALNDLMHPRNPYRTKPDFKALAVKYPEFRKYAKQDLKGKVRLDFKSPESLRTISWVLLKEDWGLDVEMPLDRLIPTIPLRMNYILWLEDLIGDDKNVHGIDIGAGAACVYALLGAKKNKWKFLVSEVDPVNFEHASKNVEKNNLTNMITVHKVGPTSRLLDVIGLAPGQQTFSFCMCNPPFFANNLEAWGGMGRSDERSEPSSVCTAAPVECIVSGGEVDFVKKMVADSAKLKSRIRVYSAMLGKKTSLLPIKEELGKYKITNYGTTEFCQGRTMRWGIGWTFDPKVQFPKRPSRVKALTRPKAPVVYRCPHSIASEQGMKYDVPSIGQKLIGLLNQLKMVYEIENSSKESLDVEVVAVDNTWKKQRQKRRMEQRLAKSDESSKKGKAEENDQNPNLEKICDDSLNNSKCAETPSPTVDVRMNDSGYNTPLPEDSKADTMTFTSPETDAKSTVTAVPSMSGTVISKASEPSKEDMDRMNLSVDEVEAYILKFTLALKKESADINLTLTWQDGENIELLHQVMQFFKNHIK